MTLVTYQGAATKVVTGGRSLVAIFGGMQGGRIENPGTPAGQGIAPPTYSSTTGQVYTFATEPFLATQSGAVVTDEAGGAWVLSNNGIWNAESLFVDFTGPCGLGVTETTVELTPGAALDIPALATDVWVNAATSGHKFNCVVYQPATQYPPTPITGPFPPSGPTGATATLPSRLYDEYTDDDDLPAFVDAYNAMAQVYVDWFNAINLPVYTQDKISGALLDWVAQGLYGLARPALANGPDKEFGAIGTLPFNTAAFASRVIVPPSEITATTDDVFKRVLTWHLFRGDGNRFNIRWLKRRIMRFLTGANGTAPNVVTTPQISVTFGAGDEIPAKLNSAAIFNGFGFNTMPFNACSVTPAYIDVGPQVNITLLAYKRKLSKDAPIGMSAFGGGPFNDFSTTVENFTRLPNAVVFKEAVQSGALELPFQQTYVVDAQ